MIIYVKSAPTEPKKRGGKQFCFSFSLDLDLRRQVAAAA